MAHGFCSSEQLAVCPLQEHFTDEHHLYHPRRKYKGRLAMAFRNLPENKEQLCRNEHNERHATEPIPVKPRTAEMREAIAQSALRGAHERIEMGNRVAVLSVNNAPETLVESLA